MTICSVLYASLASCLLIVAPESYRSGWNGFRGQDQTLKWLGRLQMIVPEGRPTSEVSV